MMLEKLCNKVNPKKNIIDPPGKGRQTRQNWEHRGGRSREGRRGKLGEKWGEENLSEQDSLDGGRTEMRARKETS